MTSDWFGRRADVRCSANATVGDTDDIDPQWPNCDQLKRTTVFLHRERLRFEAIEHCLLVQIPTLKLKVDVLVLGMLSAIRRRLEWREDGAPAVPLRSLGTGIHQYSRMAESKCQVRRISITSNSRVSAVGNTR